MSRAAGIPGGTMGMRVPGGGGLDVGSGLGARRGIASRPSGWPVLRTPKWMLAAAVVLVAGLTLAAIPHRPSTAQRAAELLACQQHADGGPGPVPGTGVAGFVPPPGGRRRPRHVGIPASAAGPDR